ncbi:MAG: YXWGXW repeat-containing protein [Acidobacteriaceae bacterium]
MNALKSIRTLLVAAAVAVPMLTLPAAQAHAGIILSVNIAPPMLPVYAQPVCPGDGYIWTPGYWAYGDDGYFWVPGTWVIAPEEGYLWTPAYWGWDNGVYLFHAGYWGPHVGFYGGINYGFGYGGFGYEGGYWNGGHFYYNRAVGNFGGARIAYGYSRPASYAGHSTVSFNGGQGGIQTRPSQQEMAAMHENHIQPTGEQMQHQNVAASNRSQYVSANHGRPGTAAASTPNAFRSNTVNNREGNQEQRIANGERSGQMTSGEAARANRTQSNIDQQVHNDRQANNGRLTTQEHQQVNKEQNHASKQIYNEKHNDKTAPHEKR